MSDVEGCWKQYRRRSCLQGDAPARDQLAPGQYAVSTSNRNFEGRQGKGGRTFLASPLSDSVQAETITVDGGAGVHV